MRRSQVRNDAVVGERQRGVGKDGKVLVDQHAGRGGASLRFNPGDLMTLRGGIVDSVGLWEREFTNINVRVIAYIPSGAACMCIRASIENEISKQTMVIFEGRVGWVFTNTFKHV